MVPAGDQWRPYSWRHGKHNAAAVLARRTSHCAHAVDGSHRWNSNRTLMWAGCEDIAAITVLKSCPLPHPSLSQGRDIIPPYNQHSQIIRVQATAGGQEWLNTAAFRSLRTCFNHLSLMSPHLPLNPGKYYTPQRLSIIHYKAPRSVCVRNRAPQ